MNEKLLKVPLTFLEFIAISFRINKTKQFLEMCIVSYARQIYFTLNKPFFTQLVRSVNFQTASVLLKGRMGAAIAPDWAMNIPHFKITTVPTGHSPTIKYRFLKTVCQSLLVCFVFVKDFSGRNLAARVWETTKKNFLYEMYWLTEQGDAAFGLCVPCASGTRRIFFFRLTFFFSFFFFFFS